MKKILFTAMVLSLPALASAQESMDALQMSQNELRGTARFQSMAGAMGALGGDISTLTQNPAGIGVYRSNDVNGTLDVDFLSTKSNNTSNDQTKATCSDLGFVGTINLNGESFRSINYGFSYNRQNSFNRHYAGTINSLPSSVSNYIATYTGNHTSGDLSQTSDNDPYYRGTAPWASVLAYNSYIINDNGGWQGLMGSGTTGYGEYEVIQSGHKDEFSINIGGNINDKFYWGLGLGIVDFNYDNYMYYGEALNKAYVADYQTGEIVNGDANYGFENMLHTTGTGFNVKFGLIFKPVNEFRFGLAVHTPTYYELRDEYKTIASFEMNPDGRYSYNGTNETGANGYWDAVNYNFTSPWRFIGSMAAVIGQSGLISFDYEYVANQNMRIGDDFSNDYPETTTNIKNNLQASHIFRVGGEYRFTKQFSLRAGYSYQTSPVTSEVENNNVNITTVSSNPSYEFDNTTQYITAGLGYKFQSGFYADMAYVHKTRKSQFNAFSPIHYYGGVEPGVCAEVKDNNNRLTFTLGYRF